MSTAALETVTETGLPAEAAHRDRLREAAAAYVRRERLVPPLCRAELEGAVTAWSATLAPPLPGRPFLGLLLGNAVWQEVVAGVPYDRRLLLLPQCLSRGPDCPGERDGVGLLCAGCGGCAITPIQRAADELGYVTLVAEGTTVVRVLLGSGKIDAVIGVGCMASLERIFPDMADHAIPGLAIPLVRDGCRDTVLDTSWLLETLRLRAANGPAPLPDLEALKTDIAAWFEPRPLAALLGTPRTQVESIGHEWLGCGGKRWRPLLAAAAHAVLAEHRPAAEVRDVVVAVECFHKASLIHDDIEDADETRYGQPTVHRRHGVPIAINVGDYLIGEGYRLLATCGADAACRARMLAAASSGHRDLCLGQGEELAFTARPSPLTVPAYVRLCERKTGAAFEVALALGAIRGGADDPTVAILSRFSRSLGVAYQVRDDLADASDAGSGGDLADGRPSVLLALACESGDDAVSSALGAFWQAGRDAAARQSAVAGLLQAASAAGLQARAEQLAAHHLHEAERALAELRNGGLKRLLRRMASHVLGTR